MVPRAVMGAAARALSVAGPSAVVMTPRSVAGAMGVDRVVPVGQALDMSVLWDGYNMLEALSRVIE